MTPEPALRTTSFLTFATAAMIALAAGAVWAWLSLWTGWPMLSLSFAVALLVGNSLANGAMNRRALFAIVAAGLTALACAYAACLIATAEVAMMLGLPLRSAFSRIGPEMAIAVAWARAGWIELSVFGVASVLAGAVAWRRKR